jgi:C_GCAxxG_C_C family probable redox protein
MLDDIVLSLMDLNQRGYFCSQILMILTLRNQGIENPGLVRAASGLSRGIAGQLATCGALTGAACLLAFYAGKGTDDEPENSSLPGMLEELWEWFEETYGTAYGGVNCCNILADGADPRERCGLIVAETYRKCQEVLVSNGFDPFQAIDT